ncbi:MAG: hypothetical protein ABR542_05940 [Desulfonatronovibrio sp.]|nr:hypothetical protein [Desulfovibrionales bacterium]
MNNPFVRGIILGGSVGLIATWFGMDPIRAFFLGILCGLLAVLTRMAAQKVKHKKL